MGHIFFLYSHSGKTITAASPVLLASFVTSVFLRFCTVEIGGLLCEGFLAVGTLQCLLSEWWAHYSLLSRLGVRTLCLPPFAVDLVHLDTLRYTVFCTVEIGGLLCEGFLAVGTLQCLLSEWWAHYSLLSRLGVRTLCLSPFAVDLVHLDTLRKKIVELAMFVDEVLPVEIGCFARMPVLVELAWEVVVAEERMLPTPLISIGLAC